MIRKVLLFLFMCVSVLLEAQVRIDLDPNYGANIICNGKPVVSNENQTFKKSMLESVSEIKRLSIFLKSIDYVELETIIPSLDFLEINTNNDSLIANIKYLKKAKNIKLILGVNQIFPKEIFDLPGLKELVISGSFFEIPSEINKASQLESIVFQQCFCLKELPATFYTLPNLTKLGIYSNGQKPKEVNGKFIWCEDEFSTLINLENIYKLTNLKYIDFNYLVKDNIPDGISKLKDLEYLYLGSQINSLPDDFSELKKMKILKLSKCNLKYTDLKEIGELTDLEELTLLDGNTKMLPSSFTQLSKLKKLNLSSEKLYGLPEELSKLINPEYTNLSIQPSEKRITELKKLIKENPNTLKFSVDLAAAYSDLAWELIEYGVYQGALEQINEGLKIDKNFRDLKLIYPIALFCNGEEEKAKVEFKKLDDRKTYDIKSGKMSNNQIIVEKLNELLQSENISGYLKTEFETLIADYE